MFDAPCFPRSPHDDASGPLSMLGMPIGVGPGDRWRFLGYGTVLHLNRTRPCGWHLVVHWATDALCWTHLYRVVPDHRGRVLVLLHQAVRGDCGQAPERFSRWPLSVRVEDCEAGREYREGRLKP